MEFVASNCTLEPTGTLFQGTDQPTFHATQALRSTSRFWNRACAIAIANESDCTLKNMKFYIDSGSILYYPRHIPMGFTGVIVAKKSPAIFRGSSGMISYELVSSSNSSPDSPTVYEPKRGSRKMHIMWQVPFNYLVYQNKANVLLGWETCSRELYQQMNAKLIGTEVAGNGNIANFRMTPSRYSAELMMRDSKLSTLSVLLFTYSTVT